MEEEEEPKRAVRIFVGGLGEAVTAEDLRRLFGSFGTVDSLQTIRTKGRCLAYLDFLTDPKSLSKLFSKYNGCVWKGGKLRLEKAKENYLARLKREWEEDAALLSNTQQPPTTHEEEKEMTETMPVSNSNAKSLRIFFPRLRKVKSVPFSGTGKHKYSFQNIKVPPLPVHFCDCEEHCSPFVTEREKVVSLDRAAETGGMNDEEINIMNAVMNKLFEKEKVSNTKHLGKKQDSFESLDALLHVNECEVDSATDDDDDLIINIETKKNKAALTGTQELERIMENQDSWSNKTNIAKEETNKSMLQVQKKGNSDPNNVKKTKSPPKLEGKSNGGVSSSPGGKSIMQTLPDEPGSGAQPTKLEHDFGESTKVSWSQKSSWKKLVGEGGNTAFSASLILPNFDSGKDQQRSDGPCTPLSTNDGKTENMERDGKPGSKPTNTEVIEEPAEAHPTKNQVIKVPAEAQPTNNQVINEHAETQDNAASKKTGRGASWLRKQSWTQLVNENNSSFSISQILPGLTFSEAMAKETVIDPADSNDCIHNGVDQNTTDGVVVTDGSNLGDSRHAGADDIASASMVEEKIETSTRERSTADVVEISETCSFMRSAASLKEWAKAKAAVSGSLKRKRGEK